MPRKVVTVTHPDGTKKVIVGQSTESQPVSSRKAEEDRRPKPIIGKAGLTSTRTAYKKGGKINVGKR